VLQDQQFQRVGGEQVVHTDVRVIAATNRDLEEMVAKNRFREDLYYRLNGYTIQLPPLRRRGDDLDLLVDHFRRQANRDLDKQVQGVASDAMHVLRRYPWPGNVREVQNVIRQAALQTAGPVLLANFLPEYLRRWSESQGPAGESAPLDDPLNQFIDDRLHAGSRQLYDEVVSLVESRLIQRALSYTGGDKLEAVKLLGVNPTSLRSNAALELLDLHPSPGATEALDTLIRPGMTMEEIEKEAILRALKQTQGHRTEAAQLLGLSVRTLQRKIREYEFD
jgi:DNA-binding NtrC family response regulator